MGGICCVTMAMGGAMLGLFYFTGLGGFLQGAIFLSFPLRIAVLGAVIMSVFFLRIKGMVLRRSKVDVAFRVSFENGKPPIELSALVDTGNTLFEPISGLPVVLIHESAARRAIDSAAVDALLKKQIPTGWEQKVRVVPFSALEKKGMLFALKPSSAAVFRDDWKDIDIYIGIHNGGLKTLGCKALLPACIGI